MYVYASYIPYSKYYVTCKRMACGFQHTARSIQHAAYGRDHTGGLLLRELYPKAAVTTFWPKGVEAGEKLGCLPGDLSQTIDAYLRPLYDALYELLGFDLVERLIEKNVIEVNK